MSLLFAAAFKEEESIPKRLIPFVIFSTWITHMFGGSAGREGVAVQIGGTVGHTIGRKIGLRNSTKILLIAGMAAGFAGLFQTPIAAVFFAMEIFTVGIIEYSALFPAIIAAFTASFTSHSLGLERFSVNLNHTFDLSASLIAKLVLLGILFGITGGLFAHLLQVCKGAFSNRFKNPMTKVFIIGCILSILLLLLHQGRYSGLGTNIISACFNEGKIYSYDWILKFIFTIVTLAAGFQGGEVTPLFSIGSSLGAAISVILGFPLEFAAALGYTALFGSATNTILAPVFIGTEVFGYQYLPYFFLVCSLAYVFNGNKSIYTAQRQAETL
jgi:H+/Cl- antiporter ClcA